MTYCSRLARGRALAVNPDALLEGAMRKFSNPFGALILVVTAMSRGLGVSARNLSDEVGPCFMS
jgi:hypothetical protein